MRIYITSHKLLLVATLLLLVACGNNHNQSVEITQWTLHYNDVWLPVQTPSCVHTDLMAHGIIPDPYVGTNEDSVQWVSQRQWEYITTLRCSTLPKADSLWLSFEALQCHADIYLDTVLLGHTDNAFHPWQFRIPVLVDSMLLRVVFTPTAWVDSLRQAAYGIPLPDRRAFSRTPPYQQGWDWGPKLNTCGITGRVVVGMQREEFIPTDLPALRPSDQWNITLQQEQDSIGQSFTFVRDGAPIFAKGANWIPQHSFPLPTKADSARYRHLLASAKEAGFNMLRVWGGGIYEPDYFYHLCDSLGIMVWQDFNFSCAIYPNDSAMLRSISDEAAYQVRRISNHPCVVLWCGNNEVENGFQDWGWATQYGWTDAEQQTLRHAIDTVFGTNGILAHAVMQYDPQQRPYIASSPLFGWGHPECVTHGDSHYWGVWWGEQPAEAYAQKTGRFMSEFGFQSYPCMATLQRMASPNTSILTLHSPEVKNHQKHARGRQIIDQAMLRYYGLDSRTLALDDYCYLSQLTQAWVTGYGILQHLLAQPHCMGSLYWQLNDCWPVASWSSIDYYGNWKPLHYRAQALFADTADLHRWQQYYDTLPLHRTYPQPRYTLGQSWNSYGELCATLRAETDLYDVWFETTPHVDGHFSANDINLASGHSITVRFIPVDPSADVSTLKVQIRTLGDIMTVKP